MLDTKALAEATAAIVREHVDKATAPLVARIAVLEQRQPERGEKGDAGERGADGRDADLSGLPELVAEEVAKAVAALPPPEKGETGEKGDKGDAGAPGEPGERGLPGEAGKDGVGLAGALIDRSGSLVVTLTDGTTRELGSVVGKDGERGSDGQDGFGFDDLQFEHDGERGFVLRFVKGERVKEFPFTVPVPLDRGVYREGETYQKGDAVTWGGSLWIAQKETTAKPDSGDGFRLAVKRGRDGKDKV